MAPEDLSFSTANLKTISGHCPDSLKASINARSTTLCPFSTNVSDMLCTTFAVWTVGKKDAHKNQQWKPNRF